MVERKPEVEKSPKRGSIEVITGCMFSGKSDELIRRIKRAPHAGHKVQAFTPSVDDRREKDTLNTADGIGYPAVSVDSSRDIIPLVDNSTTIIAIDEAQFFDMDLNDVSKELASDGIRVIVAGLDSDFRGEPFGPMAELVIEADRIDKLHAFCAECGEPASKTQRIKIINGERIPADYNDPIVEVGAEESYEARCRGHHEVPGKP